MDWEHNRITVHSPKTEHHPNGATRIVPLFPELRPCLEESWEAAEAGSQYVITRYRDAAKRTEAGWRNCNLRTQFHRIIRRAGCEPWPKPWQNLRSSRETELAEEFPVQVVCAWIGNSRPVAMEHYLQVTEDHFKRAVEGDTRAAHNPAQYVQETRRTGMEAQKEAPAFPEKHGGLRPCTTVQVGGARFELATSTV